MELCKMAQEYRRNTALLELRKKQLLAAKRHAKQYEVKYRLMRRIRTLNEMINESRLAAFEMENYYETQENNSCRSICSCNSIQRAQQFKGWSQGSGSKEKGIQRGKTEN